MFNGNLSLTSSGSGSTIMANSLADKFNSNLTATQSGTGLIYLGYAGTNELKGNLTLTQNSSSPIGNAGGTLVFNGTANQTITKSGSANPEFTRLTVNKASGSLIQTSEIKINTALTLTSGKLQTGSNTLHLGNGGTMSGASSSSFVEGTFKKTGSQAFTFPIGKNGVYAPLSITAPSSTTDVFTAEYVDGSPNATYPLSQKDSSLLELDDTGYWLLARPTGSSSPTVTVNFGSRCGTSSSSTLSFAQWDATTSKWKNKGNGANTSTTLTHTGTLSFGTAVNPILIGKLTKLKVNAGSDVAVCAGSSTGLNATITNGTSPFSYTWSPSTGLSSSTSSNPTATPSTTTNYIVTITQTSTGCTITDTVLVTVNTLPTANAGPDKTIYYGDTTTIGQLAQMGQTYLWTPSTALSSATLANTYAHPTDSTTYVLRVTNTAKGCLARDTVKVNILPPGYSCENAIDLGGQTNYQGTIINNETWVLYETINNEASVLYLDNLDNISNIKAYAGNCGNLDLIAEYSSLAAYNGEPLYLGYFSRIYISYMRVNNTINPSFSVIPKPLFISDCSDVPMPCEYIRNGGFEICNTAPNCPISGPTTDIALEKVECWSQILSCDRWKSGVSMEHCSFANGGVASPHLGLWHAGVAGHKNDNGNTSLMEEIIITKTKPLLGGATYTLSFWAWQTIGTGDKIGIIFSPTLLTMTETQNRNADYEYSLTMTAGYTLVQYTFIPPSDGEYFLHIGNFENMSNTISLPTIYTFIDDVSLTQTGSAITITGNNEFCYGSIASLNLTASSSTALTYTWTATPSTSQFPATGSSISIIPPSQTTTYIVSSASADLGCSESTITVTVNSPPNVTITTPSQTTFCSNAINLTLTPTVTGGTSPYSYNWSTGNTNSIENVTASGNYSVTVTDQNGCTDNSNTITISSNPSPNISVVTNAGVSCSGFSDGSASISISGGAPTPYTILLDNINQNGSLQYDNLTSGNHIVKVIASNGCFDLVTITISDPGEIEPSFDLTKVSCYGGNNGTISLIMINGGTPNYTILWTSGSINNSTLEDHTGLSAGTYTYTITDGNGCSYSGSITITQPAPLTASASVSGTYTCGFETPVHITSTATGGTPSYSYSWSPATGLSSSTVANPSASPSTTTAYVLTVTDAKGCTATCTTTVNVVPCCYGTYTTSSAPFDLQNQNATILLANSNPSTSTLAGNNTAIANYTPPSTPNLAINGTFTVDADLTFDGLDVTLAPNAQIIVKAGRTFTIQNFSHLYACNTMWKYIYVEPGAKLIVNSNSLIEDAFAAAYTGNLLPSNPTAVEAENAIFNKNLVGIVVWNTSTARQVLDNPNSPIKVTETKFLSQTTASLIQTVPPPDYTTLLAPFANTNSYIGIYTGNVNNLVVGLSSSTASPDNLFENLWFGINSYKSNVLVNENNTFKHIRTNNAKCNKQWGLASAIYSTSSVPTASHSLTVKFKNNFIDCCYGVYTERGVSASVKGSTFTDIYENAVTCQNTQSGTFAINENTFNNTTNDVLDNDIIYFLNNAKSLIKIEQNQINPSLGLHSRISMNGILVHELQPNINTRISIANNEPIAACRNGIVTLNTSMHAKVDNNHILLISNSNSTGNQSQGILMQNGQASHVTNNLVEGSGQSKWWDSGIRMESSTNSEANCNTVKDLGVGLFMGGWQNPLALRKNDMINDYFGVLLNHGHVGNIGHPLLAWDNKWTGGFVPDGSNLNHVHSFNVDAGENFVWVRSLSGLPWQPTPSDWDNISTTHNEMLVDIADDYISNPDLYPELNYNCTLGAGAQGLTNGGGGVTQLRLALKDTTTQPFNNAAYHWSTAYNIFGYLTENDSLLAADTSLANFYTSTKTTNIGKLYRTSVAVTNAKGFNASLASAYKDTLTSLSPSNDLEQDLKQVLNLSLQNITDSLFQNNLSNQLDSLADWLPDSLGIDNVDLLINTLDSLQYLAAKAIAEKCPYEFGPAVYIARGLASLNDTSWVQYRNSCEVFTNDTASYRRENIMESNTSASMNKLYPNPTNDKVFLEYQLQEGEVALLEVNNALGQKVIVEDNIIGNGIKSIPLTSTSNGIYFIRLLVNGSSRNQWKLCVQK